MIIHLIELVIQFSRLLLELQISRLKSGELRTIWISLKRTDSIIKIYLWHNNCIVS